MPKANIDYSKMIFYKIYCKDTNVTDLYVGRTTDLIRRKYVHKNTCKYDYTNTNCHLYKFINENGGWDNWVMEVIEQIPCENALEVDSKEQNFINTLEATLNTHIKFDDTSYKKEWYFKNQERIRLQQAQARKTRNETIAKKKIELKNL